MDEPNAFTQCERCSRTSYAQLERNLERAYDVAEWYVEVSHYFDYACAMYEAYDERVPDELTETYKAARLAIYERPTSALIKPTVSASDDSEQ
jgi:hypothetical protein